MDRERTVVTALIVLQFVLGWGFLVHISPRFPSSAWGGVLGIIATLLMLVPLAYTIVKRGKRIKQRVTASVPMPSLLAWHVYAGILGSILAILHSGHRFDSWLGIALIASMLLSVFSGYIGRHFLRYVAQDVKERKDALAALLTLYAKLTHVVAAPPGKAAMPTDGVPSVDTRELAQAIADTEYSIQANERLKQRLHQWLSIHIWTSVAFYVLLLLHIAASIQYGIRWLA